MYDCMDTDENMDLSIVKKQLTHLGSRRSLMMNVRTFWHGGEPKRGIFLMSGLLLVKSWELWDRKLKYKEFSTL
jgi:hypothetical protein